MSIFRDRQQLLRLGPSPAVLSNCYSHAKEECLPGAPKREEDEVPNRSDQKKQDRHEATPPERLDVHHQPHRSPAKSSEDLICLKCGLSFRRQCTLCAHMAHCSGGEHRRSFSVKLSKIRCPHCDMTFISKSGLASHLRWKHREVDSQTHWLVLSELSHEVRSELHEEHIGPAKTPELSHNTITDPLNYQHSNGSLVDPLHETLRHSAAPDSDSQSVNSVPRICVHPAKASTSWRQADETIDLGLKQTCPAFNSLSDGSMISVLVNAVHAYFPSSETPPQEHKV